MGSEKISSFGLQFLSLPPKKGLPGKPSNPEEVVMRVGNLPRYPTTLHSQSFYLFIAQAIYAFPQLENMKGEKLD